MTTKGIKPTQQTKRKRKNRKVTPDIWNKFSEEVDQKHDLECLYSKQTVGARVRCDLCNSQVAYDDERFLTCTNPKCGVIYKDQLDESAEWRYYGADDNKQYDPTRCGMPINPLLKESSYGCKVICPGTKQCKLEPTRDRDHKHVADGMTWTVLLYRTK